MPRTPSGPPLRDPRHRLGIDGEEAASRALAARGWTIEARRFRVGRNELDLVIRRGELVAFVEVKTRQGDRFGPGRAAIGWRKRLALARVADVWRIRHGLPGDCYRFDVVEVVPGRGREARIEHLEDAWRLSP